MENNRKPNLTEEDTNRIITDLLDESYIQDGKRKLACGAVGEVAKKFKMTEQNVRRIWRTSLIKREEEGTYHYSSKKKGNSGRPVMYDREELESAVADLAEEDRSTLRDMSRSLGVSLGYCHQLVRSHKVIMPHTSALKPILNEDNKLKRVLYASERVEDSNRNKVWAPAYNEVHVDEKWFFLSQDNFRYYISESEKASGNIRTARTKHKSHIMKVMFLCAVARPRFDDQGACRFDGKIGIWPFVEWQQARRSSINIPRGTWELKPIYITRDVYRKYMIEKVLPAIFDRFPRERSRDQTIFIQQDNPNSHFKPDDAEWIHASTQLHPTMKVVMRNQPPNSPDTNILDLGFFRAIQSLQWKQPPARTIEGLLHNVNTAFNEYDPRSLNKIWLTHQSICDEILTNHGDNDFDIPHVGKDKVERKTGKLPASFILSESARASLSIVNHV